MSQFNDAKKEFIETLYANNTITESATGIPSFADKKNTASIGIAQEVLNSIQLKYKLRPNVRNKINGNTAGNQFESAVKVFLETTFSSLNHLRPGSWQFMHVGRKKNQLSLFAQYEHLEYLETIANKNHQLRSSLGNGYLVSPDIVLYMTPYEDDQINAYNDLVDNNVSTHTIARLQNNQKHLLHASISAKLTMRSDRAQNSRTEALNLIRNRKGRLPHIVVVTAEPTGSRLASLALGTGDLDCVYHFALPELVEAAQKYKNQETIEMLDILINGNRLRDITDLPLDLLL